MSITVRSRKMLWGRAANLCAYPDCKKRLIENESGLDDESIVGEEAHIRSERIEGPRYDAQFTIEKIDDYGNLLLLCRNHHKLVDDQVNTYPVDALIDIKKSHEDWVIKTLNYDKKKQDDDEIYLTYLETINDLLSVNNWEVWTSDFMASNSIMTKYHFANLSKLVDNLLSRIWPERYQDLEIAFHNFRFILNDFLMVFSKYKTDEKSEDFWRTERIYKRRWFEQEDYDRLLGKFNYQELLLADLLAEMTRAINYLHNQIRENILANYRLSEGILLLKVDSGMIVHIHRLEYTNNEKNDLPYKGLKDFMERREGREIHFGKGLSEDYN